MSYITISTLQIPPGAANVLEGRFRERRNEVDGEPGFQGFKLLRPKAGTDRYYVGEQSPLRRLDAQARRGQNPRQHQPPRTREHRPPDDGI